MKLLINWGGLSDGSDLLAEEMKFGMEFYIHYTPLQHHHTKDTYKYRKERMPGRKFIVVNIFYRGTQFEQTKKKNLNHWWG